MARPSTGLTNRDLFHTAGKGDKNRSNPRAFAEGCAGIEWGEGIDGFEYVRPGKLVKRYGPAEAKPANRAPAVTVH